MKQAPARLRPAAVKGIRRYRKMTPLREQLLTAAVVVVSIVMATGGFFAIKNYLRIQAQEEFKGPAASFAAILSDGIDGYVGVIRDAGTKFGEAGKLDRWEFTELADQVLPEHPGFRALQWIPRVPAERRWRYERQAIRDGLKDFRIKAWIERGRVFEAEPRAEHYPVYFVEPFDGNQNTLGLDLASDAEEWRVLVRAIDSGEMVAMRRAVPTWKEGGHPEIAVVLPVFRSEHVPFTIEERRKELMGFVRGIIQLGDLIDAALPGLTAPPGLDIYILDQDAVEDSRLLYYHPSPLRPDQSSPLSESAARLGLFKATSHEIADWNLSILVTPARSHFTRVVENAPWGFLVVILLLTALLVQYLVTSQIRTREMRYEIKTRKRIEADLRAAKVQAEAANQSKSDFLAMMSHELRTPLNAVIGFAEVMEQEILGPLGNETYQTYAKDIHVSGTHLLSLINDILDLSKIEANKFELHEELIDTAESWREVLAILQERIATEALELQAVIPKDLPRLRADRRALRQILINLLSNALKFTPDGGSIEMKAEIDPQGCFVLSITDSGIGIAEQDVGSVLLPFKQVDSSLARQYEGTGLGLPLTKRLVELHGGQLAIESTLGVGTVVKVTFREERVVTAQTGTAGRRASPRRKSKAGMSGQLGTAKPQPARRKAG